MAHRSVVDTFTEMGFPARRAWLEGAVLYGAARTYGFLLRKLSKIYDRFGLSASSFNLLMLLRHGQDPRSFTQQEIGRRLVVTPSDMTGLVDRLEKKGLVKRQPGLDRRSKLLRITEEGAQLVDRVWPEHAQAVRRVTDVLDKREAELLVGAFSKLRKNLEGGCNE